MKRKGILRQNWFETAPGETLVITVKDHAHDVFTTRLQFHSYGAVDVSPILVEKCMRLGISHPAQLGSIFMEAERQKQDQEQS